MRKLFLFMNVSLDGYVEDAGHDIAWASHANEAFTPESSAAIDTMLFGRKTYEMFRNFWPTPQAAALAPEVARFINETPKVVVSHTAFDPGWKHATVISGDAITGVQRLKAQPGQSIIMFGSNTLCVSLIPHGLIDEFQIMVNPVALGAGTSLFAGLPEKAPLKMIESRPFASGTVLLTYAPDGR
jgi:dihydrofolate reductase